MISVTPKALEKIKGSIKAEDKPNLNLRVYVEGGGCAGLQYGLIFEEEEKDGDEVVAQDGFKILVDRFSAPYLNGIEIDYASALLGAPYHEEEK